MEGGSLAMPSIQPNALCLHPRARYFFHFHFFDSARFLRLCSIARSHAARHSKNTLTLSHTRLVCLNCVHLSSAVPSFCKYKKRAAEEDL
jgi:hypothetical protein